MLKYSKANYPSGLVVHHIRLLEDPQGAWEWTGDSADLLDVVQAHNRFGDECLVVVETGLDRHVTI